MWSDNPITVLGADWVTDVQADRGCRLRRVPADGCRAEDPARVRLPAARRAAPLGDLFTAEYGVDPARPGGHAAQARRRRGVGRDRPVDADPQAVVGARGDRHLGLDGRGDRRRPLQARRRDRRRAGDARALPLVRRGRRLGVHDRRRVGGRQEHRRAARCRRRSPPTASRWMPRSTTCASRTATARPLYDADRRGVRRDDGACRARPHQRHRRAVGRPGHRLDDLARLARRSGSARPRAKAATTRRCGSSRSRTARAPTPARCSASPRRPAASGSTRRMPRRSTSCSRPSSTTSRRGPHDALGDRRAGVRRRCRRGARRGRRLRVVRGAGRRGARTTSSRRRSARSRSASRCSPTTRRSRHPVPRSWRSSPPPTRECETIIVAVGDDLSAGSRVLEQGEALRIANEAEASAGDVDAALTETIQQRDRRDARGAGRSGATRARSSGSPSAWPRSSPWAAWPSASSRPRRGQPAPGRHALPEPVRTHVAHACRRSPPSTPRRAQPASPVAGEVGAQVGAHRAEHDRAVRPARPQGRGGPARDGGHRVRRDAAQADGRARPRLPARHPDPPRSVGRPGRARARSAYGGLVVLGRARREHQAGQRAPRPALPGVARRAHRPAQGAAGVGPRVRQRHERGSRRPPARPDDEP